METTLQTWRSAAEAIQTDRDVARRQAYAQAIAEVRAAIPAFTNAQELMGYYWSNRLQASAALASISSQGRVLNYQVVAAAACWQAMQAALVAR